jgi:hypothetical protein
MVVRVSSATTAQSWKEALTMHLQLEPESTAGTAA